MITYKLINQYETNKWLSLFHFVTSANPSVPVAGADPPPHRLAVAGVSDELRGVYALPATDGDGEVTGWVIGYFLRHRFPRVYRF